MIGIGLIAIPIARGRIAPMTLPMKDLSSCQLLLRVIPVGSPADRSCGERGSYDGDVSEA